MESISLNVSFAGYAQYDNGTSVAHGIPAPIRQVHTRRKALRKKKKTYGELIGLGRLVTISGSESL
jgi:hypothetical protein